VRTRHLKALTLAAAIMLTGVPLLAQDNQAQDKPQEKPLATAPSKPRPVAPAGFHLVLLVGDEKQAASPGNVTPPWAEQLTPAVMKALKDVQQFLPFKSYQTFDSTFIRGERGSTSVKAPGNEIYLVNVNSWQMNNDPGRFYVNLTVTPSEPALVTKDGAKPAPAVLTTTLEMAVGETIVAGTSRQPRSGSALVMVVTALPPSALRQ
jgi:hypothetical protein